MSRARTLVIVAVLGFCAATVSGCAVRQGPPPVRVRPDGRLVTPSQPLSFADLRRLPAGSPQQTVLELIYWAQWDSAESILDLYDPAAQRAIGPGFLRGAYATVRIALVDNRPTVTLLRRSGNSAVVNLAIATASSTPSHARFWLERIRGRWRIVYDNYFRTAVATFAHRRGVPPAPFVSTIMARYRSAYLRRLSTSRSARSSAADRATATGTRPRVP